MKFYSLFQQREYEILQPYITTLKQRIKQQLLTLYSGVNKVDRDEVHGM